MSPEIRDVPSVITLDGPAGVGKSTTARRLAAALGVPYLDTGAMYRTLGLRLGAAAADMSDEELRRRCAEYSFSLEPCPTDRDSLCLFCNGQPVGDEIRTEKAGRLASLVARLPVLREALQNVQRSLGRRWSLVAEGRDMGTRVFPEARYKFFLDARPEVRAERRCRELADRGETADKDTVLAAIAARDEQDRNRVVDPLRPASDAVIVDTSDLSPEEVLNVLLEAVRAPAFSHLAADGSLRMVDVGTKVETDRVARARAVVEMRAETLDLLRRDALPKGDVLATAKIAGIMAAKRTWEMIPLCHPLSITYADVRFTIQDEPPAVILETEVRTTGKTGVEMEALFAAQTAAATIYDMAKAVQKDMIIRDVRLLYKAGGKSGEFVAAL
ncbi:MAG TPA: cyclic pyranopterin monophosphate synthase MoaC [Candidatus Mailhella merdigallinarum]|uniref:Multifunctional fusion protein n=1 Tax=Candidatus Mailhella merdigallinarum TaxID=2838658 RepID=A0A9D2HBE8_9BACT|nr:(d)CMP kinase [Desulfovibrionaceae bacterium]HJA08078.1 cyclic pyranopterin monophosphate synthase MoaC [Candidatus Mailhella merdigallinarum]